MGASAQSTSPLHTACVSTQVEAISALKVKDHFTPLCLIHGAPAALRVPLLTLAVSLSSCSAMKTHCRQIFFRCSWFDHFCLCGLSTWSEHTVLSALMQWSLCSASLLALDNDEDRDPKSNLSGILDKSHLQHMTLLLWHRVVTLKRNCQAMGAV